ncbi:MAG: hypothetical protein ACRDBG_05655, partial [Waterburya sp.]
MFGFIGDILGGLFGGKAAENRGDQSWDRFVDLRDRVDSWNQKGYTDARHYGEGAISAGDYLGNLFGSAMEEQQKGTAIDPTQYDRMIRDSYADPTSIIQGPEFSAIRNTNYDFMSRKDAAAGRYANPLERDAKLQQ